MNNNKPWTHLELFLILCLAIDDMRQGSYDIGGWQIFDFALATLTLLLFCLALIQNQRTSR